MAIGNFLTTDEVARKLRVSPGRVRQFVAEGRLHYERKIGSAALFDAEVVEQFAKQPRPTGRPKQAG